MTSDINTTEVPTSANSTIEKTEGGDAPASPATPIEDAAKLTTRISKNSSKQKAAVIQAAIAAEEVALAGEKAAPHPPTKPEQGFQFNVVTPQDGGLNSIAKTVYYNNGAYFTLLNDRWVALTIGELTTFLDAAKAENETVTKTTVKQVALSAKIERSLAYVGPLAGYHAGVHDIGNAHILVTEGVQLPKTKKGAWPHLEKFLRSALPNAGDVDQMVLFMALLKVVRQNLSESRRSPIPAIVFAGEAGAGKSVMIRVFAYGAGGRMASAHANLSGGTAFNGELARSEVLVVDDEVPTSTRNNAVFASRLKSTLVAATHRIEAKGREAISLPLTRCVLIATNNEPAALRVLPPLTADLEDKLMLFMCGKGELPATRATSGRLLCETLESEMPAFLHAVDALEILVEFADKRYGVRAWKHPDLLKRLESEDPVTGFLRIVDLAVETSANLEAEGNVTFPVEGRSSEILAELETVPAIKTDLADFLRLHASGPSKSQYIGTLLHRAMERGSGRVEELPLSNGNRRWHISAAKVALVAPTSESAKTESPSLKA